MKYYITNSQLGMLMGDTDEKRTRRLLNKIIEDQQINPHNKISKNVKVVNKKYELE